MRSFVSRTRTEASTVAVVIVGAILAACSNDAVGPGANWVEAVVVTPPTATVAVGANLTLSAEARDANGTVLTSQRVSWASEDPSIAEVSRGGVVTGLKIGSVLIAASARGKDAFARVTVNPTPVVTVRISTTHRSMLVGEVAQLTAEPLDAGGSVLSGRPIMWTTSDASIATVTGNGLVTAVSVGGAIITASSEGKSAVASITVSAVPVATITVAPSVNDLVVGQTSQLSVQLRNASGETLTGRPVVWSTNSAAVATVASDGLVTAVGQGTTTITATSEGKSASATVNVTPRPVSAVIVSPGQVTIFVAQNVQLSALVTDDRGQVLTGKTVSFSSSNVQVATVTSIGVVTGIAPGTATITAVSEGGTGTATVTISPEPVAAVDVTPSPATVYVGNAIQLTATPKNASGQLLTGRTITWSSGTPALASVSSTGVVTGLAAGNAVIIATVDGKQGSGMVTVRMVPVASVSVTPATASTTVGQTVSFTATTLDAGGNVLAGRIVGWSSSDNTIATVSSSGVVTGVASGTATITASSEGQSGTATVTIGFAPVATVSVSPAQSSVNVGLTVQLTATPMDANGQPLTGRTVSWTSGTPGVATVSLSGLVTGVASGTATITATIDGVAGSASVTVNPTGPGPIATIAVSPSTATVNVAWSTTLTATARDANGTVITGAPITWSTSDATVATVSSAGVVTGVAAGTVTITATSGSVTGTAAITVQPAPVDHIVVTPSNSTIDPGQTVRLTATLYDIQNNVLTGRTVTWSSSDATKVTVDSNGLARGVKKGTVTITASSGGKSGTATVRVR